MKSEYFFSSKEAQTKLLKLLAFFEGIADAGFRNEDGTAMSDADMKQHATAHLNLFLHITRGETLPCLAPDEPPYILSLFLRLFPRTEYAKSCPLTNDELKLLNSFIERVEELGDEHLHPFIKAISHYDVESRNTNSKERSIH